MKEYLANGKTTRAAECRVHLDRPRPFLPLESRRPACLWRTGLSSADAPRRSRYVGAFGDLNVDQATLKPSNRSSAARDLPSSTSPVPDYRAAPSSLQFGKRFAIASAKAKIRGIPMTDRYLEHRRLRQHLCTIALHFDRRLSGQTLSQGRSRIGRSTKDGIRASLGNEAHALHTQSSSKLRLVTVMRMIKSGARLNQTLSGGEAISD